jgi:phosphate transport system permease protein
MAAHRQTTGQLGSAAGQMPAVPVRRRVGNALFWGACFLALLLVVGPTLWLVVNTIGKALPHFHWSVVSTDTVGAGTAGGLLNAILGTFMLTVGVLIISGTISILTGLYLSEFSRGRSRPLLRGAYEVLSGIPSIVLGYVGYVVLVVQFHWGYGLLPAVLVLSVITIPYIAKATETSLAQVPSSYREGAEALGISQGWALRKIVLKSAIPGITTGMLVALAIAAGESAPLLFTAGWSTSNPSFALMHSPLGFLTYAVWSFSPSNSPITSANQLSYDAGLILLIFVLLLILVGRLIAARSRRYAE